MIRPSFIDAFTEAMLVVEVEGRILEINAEACRVLGTRTSRKPQSIGDFVDDGADGLRSFLNQASKSDRFVSHMVASRATVDEETLVLEGVRLGMDTAAVLLRVRADGSKDGVATSGDEIEALNREARLRRKVEADLSRAQIRYHTLFNGMNDVVLVYHLDSDGSPMNLIDVNESAVRILGYSREELLRMRVTDLTDPARIDIHARVQDLRRDGHLVVNSWHITKDGRRVPMEVSAHLFNFEGLPTVLSICRDVSERRRAEEMQAEILQREQEARREAEASREQLAFLVQTSSILAQDLDYERTLQDLADLLVPRLGDWCVVTMVDERSQLQRVAVSHQDRTKMEAVLSIANEYPTPQDAPYGVSWVIRTGQPEILEDIPQELLEESAQDERHLELLRDLNLQSAVTVPIRLRDRTLGAISLIYSDSGRRYSRHDLLFAQELASRAAKEIDNARLYRAAEQARDKAEEMNRLKSAFLANMSHEIRTPLTSILGFASLLEKRVEPENRHLAEYIHIGGQRLLETLDAVLSLSQLESQMKEFDLHPIDLRQTVSEIATLIEPRAREKGLTLEVDGETDPVYVYADSGAITSILQNLIGNAIKFTSEGGVRIEVSSDQKKVRMVVSDTGVGMEASFMSYLFEPFYQESTGWNRDYEGTGLGLAITKRLVEGMNGTIEVSSKKHRGSRFTVTLDAAPRPAPQQRSSTTGSGIASGRKPRILLVEDNPESGMFMEVLLSEYGEVTLVTSAIAAIDAADNTRDGFDALILDINLGEGRSGTEILHELRSRTAYRGVPAAAVTAYALPGDRERLEQEGFEYYLSKPFSPEDLTSLVERLLSHA